MILSYDSSQRSSLSGSQSQELLVFLISKGDSKYSVWFSAPVAVSLQKRVYLFEFWHLRSVVADQTPLSRHHVSSEQNHNAVSGEFYSIIFRKQTRYGNLQGGSSRTVDFMRSSSYTAKSSVMTWGFEAWKWRRVLIGIWARTMEMALWALAWSTQLNIIVWERESNSMGNSIKSFSTHAWHRMAVWKWNRHLVSEGKRE